MKKNIENIWKQVPADYYHKGISSNLFQFIWHSIKINVFKQLTNKTTPKKILDIGCAGGFFPNEVSKIFPKSQIIGVDVYKNAISFAKKNHPHISFYVADGHKLPFKTNTFDLVISYETIEHVVDPIKFLSEARRVLKPSGKALVVMDSGSLLFRIVWYFWENTKGKVWKSAHLHPFNHKELETIIKKAGFKITTKRFSHLGMEVSFLLQKSIRKSRPKNNHLS